jgi:alpha-mannosidase
MGLGETLSLRRPGSIKKGNRKSEILLRDAEVGVAPNFDLVYPLSLTCPQHVATLASIFKGNEYKYPKPSLDDSWEKVLLNQCM